MLEISIININFVLLFVTMILYWLKGAFFLPQKFIFLPNLGSVISSVLQAFFLCFRWFSSGHFPLSNLYESLLFLSWSLTALLVFLHFDLSSNKPFLQLQQRIKNQPLTSSPTSLVPSLLGSIMTPAILLINTFAVFSLPADLKVSTALVPALQSNWLVMHVTVMILSYAALLAGCLFSIAYLILSFFISSPIEKSNPQPTSVTQFETLHLEMTEKNQTKFFTDLATKLDNLSYRILGLGFPLLTIGLLSGAVWANQTWGSYWSWDPKETWALITWFVFAIYLHTRISKGWSGRESAFLAVFGFIILWICYLGVNLMGKGLHSYGFLT